MRKILILGLLTSAAVFAADGIAKVFDDQITMIEREVLGLAQKMPADKYGFAPTNGTFTGVRTFGMQVRHIATEMFLTAQSITGEKPPVDIGTSDDGPDSLKTKDQIIEYFKTAIATSRKAIGTITDQNMHQAAGRRTKAAAAGFFGWHSFDHYGQMVVYARMNGVTPGGPPPAGKKK